MSEIPEIADYKYGFQDDGKIIFSTGKGLQEETIRTISSDKNEPEWMLDYRLEAFKAFQTYKDKLPTWGVDLSDLDFDDFTYYQKATDKPARTWEEVPDKIKETFDRIGIPQAEREYLAGASVQYESQSVYNNLKEEIEKLGIIFTDTDTALREYPELFKEHFGTVVKPDENFQTSLNASAWSGGTFIYVPKNVKTEVPLQTYFRMNNMGSGQFERTLIIVDEGASIHYIEGCTAPTFSSANLHAAVVEIIVKKDASCRYTTIQNWSDNVYNLVTKRGYVHEGGSLEWVDGNIGAYRTMKYPSCILAEPHASGSVLSIAFAGENQHQHTGAKMIHLAPHTNSTIVSKSIAKGGGMVDYLGKTYFSKNAVHSKSHIECDTIIVDDLSKSDTIPFNRIENSDVTLEHEAKVSRISEEQLFYLMSRGLDEAQATEMIVMGFVQPFAKEMPMEYAVELNRLIAFEMEGSVG